MQESAAPNAFGETRGGGDRGTAQSPLTPEEIEAILGDFRRWLSRLPDANVTSPPAESVDLSTLVRGFTALRQEINLQTRAVRSQTEQAAQTLESLALAAEQTSKPEDKRDSRPLLKTLIDARDSLALARAHVAKTRDALVGMSAPPPVSLSLPAWARWLGLDGHVRRSTHALEEWSQAASKACAGFTSALESLLTGYAMSLQRLDRSIEQSGLRRIECVGKPFDSEVMEVVEVVVDATRATSEVLDEVRPGYLLDGVVFRFAQVRVARP